MSTERYLPTRPVALSVLTRSHLWNSKGNINTAIHHLQQVNNCAALFPGLCALPAVRHSLTNLGRLCSLAFVEPPWAWKQTEETETIERTQERAQALISAFSVFLFSRLPSGLFSGPWLSELLSHSSAAALLVSEYRQAFLEETSAQQAMSAFTCPGDAIVWRDGLRHPCSPVFSLTDLPRLSCTQCGARTQLLCPIDFTSVQPQLERLNIIPRVSLPLSISIVLSAGYRRSKSTATHAIALAADRETHDIHQFPQIPLFDPSDTVVAFPSADAVDFSPSLAASVRRVIFLEGTWPEAEQMNKHTALKGLTKIALNTGYATRFWRHQSMGPSFLSSIESIYCFFVRHYEATAAGAYDGRYDNLLWLFAIGQMKYKAAYRSNEQLIPSLGYSQSE